MTASLPPEDLMPVLVADLADDEARDILEAAAFAGSRVFIPLETAPVSAAVHVLEVHLPGSPEPLLYLAEPLGPPNDDGFPLRIRLMANAPPPAPSSGKNVGTASDGRVRARPTTRSNIPITDAHAADLASIAPTAGPPAAREDQLVGRALAGGKLKIEQMIGRGGVGAVYKARHRELRMSVAVKVLHESFQQDIEFCKRFYSEALAASRLDHPNITRVIDFGQEPDGLLYFAMEFLDGVELRTVLERERVLGVERVAEIMMQVCAGLSHAHARGFLHRDIKPENLVLVPGVDDDGKPVQIAKVCDFGIAQHRTQGMQDGGVAGTPEYMSPEQCRGDELDARSDVYAVGIVLYEMATGKVPFRAERPQSILNKHQFTTPPKPSELNPAIDLGLEKLILRTLEKEAADRPQSLREVRVALRELVSPAVKEASPPPSVVGRSTGHDLDAAPPSSTRTWGDPAPQGPEWLERGPVYSSAGSAAAFAEKQAQAVAQQASVHDEVADALAFDAAGWLRRFARTPDPRAFGQLAARLEPALRVLAMRGDPKTLWTVSSTLHGLSMDGTQSLGSRAHVASKVLRVFEDPAILGQIAEQLLAGSEDLRDYARRLLLHGGVAGAYGLYGARVKLASDQAIRGPFVLVLKDFGGKAWPVARAALEKILQAGDQTQPTMELAEDLLLCVPIVGDDTAGHIVVKYLRVNVSGVCRAATAAIVKLWADRAKPLLVGMLQSKEDVVRIAGIAGLRQLNAIDEHIVPRLHALLAKRVEAGEEARAAAAVALASATGSAMASAVSALTQVLTPSRDTPHEHTTTTTPGVLSREDAVIVATARSLLVLGGKNYRSLVAERGERSAEPLRSQLRRLLA
jgi:serine/threonine-protein kinase